MSSFKSFTHSGFGKFINSVARVFVPYKKYPVDPKVDHRKKTHSEKFAEELNKAGQKGNDAETAAEANAGFREQGEEATAEADTAADEDFV